MLYCYLWIQEKGPLAMAGILQRLFGDSNEKRSSPAEDRGTGKRAGAGDRRLRRESFRKRLLFRKRLQEGATLEEILGGLRRGGSLRRATGMRPSMCRYGEWCSTGGVSPDEDRGGKDPGGGYAGLNALTGKGVHVITVNDYLARRDSEWMGPIFTCWGWR